MATLIKNVMEKLSNECRTNVVMAGRTWISRNSKCICGSQKRFKRCCMEKKTPENIGVGRMKSDGLI